jgi:hypothetical protein
MAHSLLSTDTATTQSLFKSSIKATVALQPWNIESNMSTHLRLHFTSQVGAYYPGDIRMVLRLFAYQFVRAGQAYVVRTPEEVADARIAAGLVKPRKFKPAPAVTNPRTGNRALSETEIAKLYGRVVRGKGYSMGRPEITPYK